MNTKHFGVFLFRGPVDDDGLVAGLSIFYPFTACYTQVAGISYKFSVSPSPPCISK